MSSNVPVAEGWLTKILVTSGPLEERDTRWRLHHDGRRREKTSSKKSWEKPVFTVHPFWSAQVEGEIEATDLTSADNSDCWGWKVSRIASCWSGYFVRTGSGNTDWEYCGKEEQRIQNCGWLKFSNMQMNPYMALKNAFWVCGIQQGSILLRMLSYRGFHFMLLTSSEIPSLLCSRVIYKAQKVLLLHFFFFFR